MTILRLFTNIFFDCGVSVELIFAILYVAGLWGMFQKSGLKGWYALIPVYREYELALCAGREVEGRVFSLMALAKVVISASMVLLDYTAEQVTQSTIGILLTIGSLVVILVYAVYLIRVVFGLIDVYGVKRRWVWLWILSYTRWIPAMIWGWSKKYQPGWQVEDIKAEMERLATHGTATVMDEGLTVNLKERTAREFFKKKVLLKWSSLSSFGETV